MKKTKYEMVVYIGDNMLETSVELTGKQYKEKVAELLEQHHKHTIEDDCEFYIEHKYKTQEYEKFTCYYHIFSHGISEIYLYKRECKDGYKWTK